MFMKKQRAFGSLLLLICMVFAFSVSVSAYKNQWVTSGGATYYYGSNGKKYTGGPRSIKKGSKKYMYMFDSKGRLVKNQITYIKSRKKFYYSQANGTLLTTFKRIGSHTYYGSSSGYLRTGLQTYNNKLYYFDTKNCRMIKNRWQKVGKYYYYFNGAGRAYRNGIYSVKKVKYYFDSKGRRSSGPKKVGNYYYGFSAKTGKQLFGWQKAGSTRYYFDKSNNGRALMNGFKTIKSGTKKKTYYFNANAARVTGWVVIGTKRYYMDPSDNGAQTFGRKKINGKTYNFGTKGYVTYTPSGNYTIRVNRAKNVITIYDGNTPVKAMTCSVGARGFDTPTGTFFIQSHHRWWNLNGPSTGQYCSHFLSEYLFHSVPMYGPHGVHNPYNVSASDFNKLGTAASGGCIRLCVADAKWIYDNARIGTKVVISDKEATPLGKPVVVKMKAGTVGKDPTDRWS